MSLEQKEKKFEGDDRRIDGDRRQGWHFEKKITLNQIIFLVVEAIVFTGAVAVFYSWLNSSIGSAASKAADAAEKISAVATDLHELENRVVISKERADEAFVIARSNQESIRNLRDRLTRRDEEVLRRLERIETLLLKAGRDDNQ